MSLFESPTAAAPKRSAATGWLCQVLGVLLFLVGVSLLVSIFLPSHLKSLLVASMWLMGLGVLGLCACHGGALVFNWGRRMRLGLIDEVLLRDSSPVFYLRSFGEDAISAKSFGGAASIATEEEQLALAFGKVGPVVAIGRPGERAGQIGAKRIYVSDEEWREKVREYLQRSKIVILRASFSDGLIWELDQVVRLVTPERLLVVVPVEPSLSRNLFFSKLQGMIPSALPNPGLSPPKFSRSSIAGFMHFEKNWTSHFLPLQRSPWDVTISKELVSVFQTTLQPFYLKLGLKIEPRRAYGGLILTLLLIVFGTIAVLFVAGLLP